MKLTKLISLTIFIFASLSINAQLLYKVTGNKLSEPSYIFGTHHLFTIDFAHKIPGFDNAIASCKAVYGEMVVEETATQEDQAKMQSAMLMPPKALYTDFLSKEDYEYLGLELQKYFGEAILLQQLFMLKPNAISAQLSIIASQPYMDAPLTPDFKGIDAQIQEYAKSKQFIIGGLESADSQIDLLFDSSIKEQATDLVTSLRKTDLRKDAELMIQLYREQDSQGMYLFIENNTQKLTTTNEEYNKELEKMLFQRNRAWVAQLPAIFSAQPTFVAVGVGHLHGSEGVISLLEKEGYTVEPVL